MYKSYDSRYLVQERAGHVLIIRTPATPHPRLRCGTRVGYDKEHVRRLVPLGERVSFSGAWWLSVSVASVGVETQSYGSAPDRVIGC